MVDLLLDINCLIDLLSRLQSWSKFDLFLMAWVAKISRNCGGLEIGHAIATFSQWAYFFIYMYIHVHTTPIPIISQSSIHAH